MSSTTRQSRVPPRHCVLIPHPSLSVVSVISLVNNLSSRRFTGLWRHPDFLKLWGGQTVSVFGTLITRFALPLVAILALDATPLQVALLGVAEVAPGLVVGLFAGVWVDRVHRRPLLIAADLGRAVALASIPVAALLDALTVVQLYIIAGIVSVFSVLFDVAYLAYLPSLVRRDQLVEGNSKLEASASVSEVAGFGLAGVLVQALTAPVAILVDTVTFLVSALSLTLIRTREVAVRSAGREGEEIASVPREIAEGMRLVWRNRILRALAGATVTRIFFAHIFVAVLLLFLTTDLGLPPAALGFIFSIGGISAFVGAIFVQRITRRWGVGRTMIGSLAASTLPSFFMPLAFGPPVVAGSMAAIPQAFDGAGMAYHINSVSLTQAITPERLMGRVNASMRVAEGCATLLGLLIGGLLGQWIGLRATVFTGMAGSLLSIPWLWFSPVRSLREHPPVPEGAPLTTARELPGSPQ